MTTTERPRPRVRFNDVQTIYGNTLYVWPEVNGASKISSQAPRLHGGGVQWPNLPKLVQIKDAQGRWQIAIAP